MTRVFIDPDGTHGDYVYVIVLARTGVEYGAQCEGVCTSERWAEGYLVPVQGLAVDAHDRVNWSELYDAFNRGGCAHNRADFSAREHIGLLRSAVRKIPFWTSSLGGDDERGALDVDESRIDEAVEAWLPVTTPAGPGVLVWPNCD